MAQRIRLDCVRVVCAPQSEPFVGQARPGGTIENNLWRKKGTKKGTDLFF